MNFVLFSDGSIVSRKLEHQEGAIPRLEGSREERMAAYLVSCMIGRDCVVIVFAGASDRKPDGFCEPELFVAGNRRLITRIRPKVREYATNCKLFLALRDSSN